MTQSLTLKIPAVIETKQTRWSLKQLASKMGTDPTIPYWKSAESVDLL